MRPISRNECPLARRRRTSCSIFGDRCRGIYALPVSSSNDGWLTEKLRGPFESTVAVPAGPWDMHPGPAATPPRKAAIACAVDSPRDESDGALGSRATGWSRRSRACAGVGRAPSVLRSRRGRRHRSGRVRARRVPLRRLRSRHRGDRRSQGRSRCPRARTVIRAAARAPDRARTTPDACPGTRTSRSPRCPSTPIGSPNR